MLGHYLMFNRNCAEALQTYEAAFGVKAAEVQKYGDMPPNPAFPVAEADKGLVLHARMTLDGAELMCADSRERWQSGTNMYVTVTTGDEAALKRAWDALAPGGEVYMALTPTFFAKLHGSLRDRFGISWMLTLM